MKTASRILGTAFFLEGFEVQDAPRYGAERRGAPMFAYVRASRNTINERGIIRRPDLVVVADDTLVPVSAAGVLQGVTEHTVMLINSNEKPEAWKDRLNVSGQILTMPSVAEKEDRLEPRFISASCAGVAARLVGVISWTSLKQAISDELAHVQAKYLGLLEELVHINNNASITRIPGNIIANDVPHCPIQIRRQ